MCTKYQLCSDLWRYGYYHINHHIHVYTNVSFSDEAHIEFCCHLARGNIDPKETPVYEYVKFVGDFKFHKNGKEFSEQDSEILMGGIFFYIRITKRKKVSSDTVPTSSCNGLELALPRSLQASLEEQVCLIATVRLVTPQFLKVRLQHREYRRLWLSCTWH